MRVKRKPIITEAVRWNKQNLSEVYRWLSDQKVAFTFHEPGFVLKVITAKGIREINEGQWIVRGIKGCFYPVDADVFELSYEQINEGGGK